MKLKIGDIVRVNCEPERYSEHYRIVDSMTDHFGQQLIDIVAITGQHAGTRYNVFNAGLFEFIKDGEKVSCHPLTKIFL